MMKDTRRQSDFDDVREVGSGDEEEAKKLFSNSPEKFEVGSSSPVDSDVDMADGRVLKEYGQPVNYDPSFRGPIHNRSCTDIVCCFLFILFVLAMVIVSIFAYARGNPYRLVYPTDSQADVCGLGELKDRPYLFFFDLVTCAKMGAAIVTGCLTPQVCVKECPKENSVYMSMDRSQLICKYHVDVNKSPYREMSVDALVKKNLCASYYLKSTPVVNRCMPNIFAKVHDLDTTLMDEDGQTKLVRANGEEVNGELLKEGTLKLAYFYKLEGTAELLFRDIMNSMHLILGCLVLTMLISMLWIVLLRWITIIMVWITIILFIGLFGFGTGFSFYKYYDLKNSNLTEEYGLPYEMKFDFEWYLQQKNTWLAFGCTGGTIFLIFLLIIICLCGRILLASRLISEASIAVSHMWCVLFWPLIPFLAQVLFLAYWVSSSVFIASLGEPEFYNDTHVVTSNDVDALLTRVPCDPKANGTLGDLCSFVKYGGSSYKKPLLFFMLFMFFWVMNFISSLEQMTLSGAFASYYWAWNKPKDIPAFPLGSSFWRSLRYHTGSLAFGSLIIAIVQMIRAILEYIHRKLKGTENSVARFFLKCLKCCFWCLEKFLRYINKNAFILISIHGRSFCAAAQDGFNLIMRNVLRAVVLDKVCDFLMLISKLMVTGGMAVLAFFWFRGELPLFQKIIPELEYTLAPVIVVVIGAYMIADTFFDVYGVAVDTIFLCFLEDLERNDGSNERPYFMSKTKNLKRLLYSSK